MRKNMLKTLLISTALGVALTAGAGASVLLAKAENDAPVALNTSNFQILGAGVRFKPATETTGDGIRFQVAITEEAYQETYENNIRLLVMPKKLVSGDLEIGETYSQGGNVATTKDEPTSGWRKETLTVNGVTANYYCSYAYVWGIPASYYDVELTARAYYDDGQSIVYTNAIDRSLRGVATAALNDLKDTENTESRYVNAVNVDGVVKYSRYNAEQRSDLFGYLPYDVTAGGIDYAEGVYTTTSKETENRMISQDEVGSTTYVIKSSMKTPKTPAVATPNDANDTLDEGSFFRGVMFNYSNDGNVEKFNFLDWRYREFAANFGGGTHELAGKSGYILYLRECTGSAWSGGDYINFWLEAGKWYDIVYLIENHADGSVSITASVTDRETNMSATSARRTFGATSVYANHTGRGVGYLTNKQETSFGEISVENYTVKTGSIALNNDGITATAGTLAVYNDLSFSVGQTLKGKVILDNAKNTSLYSGIIFGAQSSAPKAGYLYAIAPGSVASSGHNDKVWTGVWKDVNGNFENAGGITGRAAVTGVNTNYTSATKVEVEFTIYWKSATEFKVDLKATLFFANADPATLTANFTMKDTGTVWTGSTVSLFSQKAGALTYVSMEVI